MAEAEEHSDKSVDKAVFGLCELLGLVFALPFGDDLYHGTPVTLAHGIYLAVGVVFVVTGPLWPKIRAAIPANVGSTLCSAATDFRTWLALLLIVFMYSTQAPSTTIISTSERSTVGRPAVLITEPFVTDQEIRRQVDQNKGVHPVITYHGEYVVTGSHLRMFLEYRPADFHPAMKPTRVSLGDTREFVKGGDLSLSLISRDDSPNGYAFWWGMEGKDKGLLFLSNYQARIIFVDDNGKEQRYYFLITGGSIPNTVGGGITPLPYPDVISSASLDFPAKWETIDAQR